MIVRANEQAGAEWDRFVADAAGGTAFHRAAWQRVCASSMGHECVFLEARSAPDGPLEGVLPLVRVRSRIFGHFLMSMPFVNYGGPLGSDDAIRALVADAVERADRERVDLLELRSRLELPVSLPVSHRKISVLLDLPANADALFKAFPGKLRSQIRRPQKAEVRVVISPDTLPDFMRVFSAHMRDLGTPSLGEEFFRALREQFGSDLWIAVAYLGEEPIACGMGFRWGTEFEITWASSLRRHNPLSANMLVYWELMQFAIANGCTVFNFGRTTPGSPTHRFKQQWGGRDEQLHWYQHRRGAVAATPSPDAGAFSWGPRIWRRLPLALTTRLGPRVVRLIP
jgi:FemAB-related protein (PEP-CTERM system-associated)